MKKHGKHAKDIVLPRHKTKDFLEKKERLRKLLIPFPEKALAEHAPEALDLLHQDPDLLDADTIHALVAEQPKKKLEEGQDDNYAAGFGEVKDRDVTSEWSRWVTFAGDVGVWAGQPFEKREGFTQYLTQDPSRNRIRREYSDRVAVCVTILKLIYQDLYAADSVAAIIKDITNEARGRAGEGPDELIASLRKDGRLDTLWKTDSSLIRGHVNLSDGGLLGNTKEVMENELRVFIGMVRGAANENEDKVTARKNRKKEAKIRQQMQALKSRFNKAGANSGVAEMLSLLCVREAQLDSSSVSVGKSGLQKQLGTLKNRSTASKADRADRRRMREVIQTFLGSATSADLDGDGEISLHELIQKFRDAKAFGVANLLSLISVRKQLVGCDLRGARLDDIKLQFAAMDGCDMSNASLVHTDLTWTDMMGADFTGADFTGATLVECDMRNTKLSCAELPDPGKEQSAIGVSFYRANLAKCNFRDAQMSFADLREVDARQAIFNGAVMRFSKFEPLGGGGVTDMRQAFFDDADLTGCVGLEETQFNELVPRKMKKFVLHKMTVKKFVRAMLPSSAPDDGGEDDGEDDDEEDEGQDEEDDEDDEEDDEDDDEEDDEEEEDGGQDEDEQGDADNGGDEEQEEDAKDNEGKEDVSGNDAVQESSTDAGAAAASEKLKQQHVRAKKAHEDRLKQFRAQEDKLIQEYAERWDRHGNKATRTERVAAYIAAVDDGESDAIKPLQKKMKALKKAHKHVTHAVHLDRSAKKDPRSPAMAEFLLDTTLLEKQYKLIVATKDEGVEYTRSEIVAFARTADELVRSAMSILRGEWVDGRTSDLRTRRYKDMDGRTRYQQWLAHLVPVSHYKGKGFSPEYTDVMFDENLMRVKQQWCELLTGEKGLCLQYRTNQKGASDGETLKVVTKPFPNYKGLPTATSDAIFGARDTANNHREMELTETQNPISTDSENASRRKQLVSFSIGVRELQHDGDVDNENLVYVFSHFDPRVLSLWMEEINKAKDQETQDMENWKGTKAANKNFDASCSIRYFQFDPSLSEAYNASLTLTLPNEHAPNVLGWRSYLPTSCNGVDDENDLDEPDLATPSGRALRRFEKVRADLDMLCAEFKTAVPEDIDERAESLELFLAEQNLTAMTVYDESAVSNMFKMTMKVMRKDLKELEHLSATLLNLTLPISPTNWEDILDTWLAVEHLCGEVESQKGQRILEMLFADDNVTEALGMAMQLREIRTMTNGTPGDALPEGLMKRLKQGLGSHIKRHYYTYYKAVGMEQANIDRVVHYQAIGIGVVNSIIMAMFVGLFNFLVTYYLDEDSIGQVKSFVKSLFFFF